MSVLDELVAGALEDQRTRELTVSLEDAVSYTHLSVDKVAVEEPIIVRISA